MSINPIDLSPKSNCLWEPSKLPGINDLFWGETAKKIEDLRPTISIHQYPSKRGNSRTREYAAPPFHMVQDIVSNLIGKVDNYPANRFPKEVKLISASTTFPSFDQIELLAKWRDTLIIWDELAKKIEDEFDLDPFENGQSISFSDWCEIYKEELQQIEKLDLSKLSLACLPDNLELLSNLKSLDLGHNKFGTLPSVIGKLTNLETLVLKDNFLKKLPDEIKNLKNLEHLNLRSNDFSILPLQIESLSKLISLKLDNNLLKTIPSFIGKLTKLKELELSGNALETLPDEIGNLTQLETLDLQENEWKGFPSTLANLQLTRFFGEAETIDQIHRIINNPSKKQKNS